MNKDTNVVPLGGPDVADEARYGEPGNPRPVIWLGVLIVALGFGGFGVWAATAPLDSAVGAEGTIMVESNRQIVDHKEGGIVRAIKVEEGDRVAEGQPLIALDDTEAAAESAILRKQLDAALAREARLLAERDGEESIAFPDALTPDAFTGRSANAVHLSQTLSGQRMQFLERRRSLEGQVAIQEERIRQLHDEIRGYEAQISSRERQIAILEDELEGLRVLHDGGHAPRTRILAMEREQAQLEGDIGADRAAIARTENGIGEAEMQITQLRQQKQEEVVAELQEVQDRLADLKEEYAVASDVLERREVRAPLSGVVQNLQVHTEGGVVQPGSEIMQVIPEDDRLVIEAQIAPEEIDRVLSGQPADVRMTALNPRTTPVLEGEVVNVSADRLEDPNDGTAYYEALVEVPEEEIARLGGDSLRAGMPAEVLIKAGERTLADYLLKPLSDAMSRGFIED